MQTGTTGRFEELLARAKPLLDAAVKHDEKGNKDEAVRNYVAGVALVLEAVKVAPDGSRATLRERAECYTRRCEELKSHRGGKISDFRSYVIREDSTGHSYDSIFSTCINEKLTEVTLEDPYIASHHQIMNFLMFCELLTRKARNVRRVTLVTQSKRDQNPEQATALAELKESLKQKHITFDVEYRDFHDRHVKFNNGYEVKMGRGLDIFKPVGKYHIGQRDYEQRPCKETTFEIYKRVA